MSPFDPIYETLAKGIAYLPNPTQNIQVLGFLNATGYQIDRVFDDPVTGFQALGLISTTPDKPPVIAFRGTDAAIDDLANTDRRGVAFNQFEANRTAIGNWLTQIGQDRAKNPRGLLVDAIGHSLGGSLAQRTVTEFTNSIGETITFNSPAIDRTTVNIFRQKGVVKPITHYIVSGDFVSLGGEEFLPGRVFLQTIANPEIDTLAARNNHGRLGLLTNPPVGFSQREISVAELSSPNFNYNDNPDYRAFLADLGSGIPELAAAISTRATTEQIRTSGASFLGTVFAIDREIDPSTANFLVGDDLGNIALGLDGDDTIIGNGGNDTLFGNQQNDTILGGTGSDTLFGGKNNDLLFGNQDADVLYGNLGNDTLFGGKNNDLLFGNQDDDLLSGDLGNDSLYGGLNSDTLIGGDGDDFLSGDFGTDTLTGSGGRDTFVLASVRPIDTIVSVIDTVLDFRDGEDVLGLSGGLTFGQLSVTQSGNGTLIQITNSGEILASLIGVQASSIAASDFTSV